MIECKAFQNIACEKDAKYLALEVRFSSLSVSLSLSLAVFFSLFLWEV